MASMQWAQGLGWRLLAWLAGMALQLQQSALGSTARALGVALLSLALLGLCWALARSPWWGRWSLAHGLAWVRPLGMALALGSLSWALTEGHALWRHAPLPAQLEGREVLATGVVASLPQRSALGWRFALDVEALHDLNGQALQDLPGAPQRLDVAWYDPSERAAGLALQALGPTPQAGERWRLALRLKAPHGAMNPGGFDAELWLWSQGVQAQAQVRQSRLAPPPQRLAQTGQYAIERWRQQVRALLWQQLGRDPVSAPGPEAEDAMPDRRGVVAALTLGEQGLIERQAWDLFRATGVAHLMSISGVHITMQAWLVGVLVSALWRAWARRGGPGVWWIPAVTLGQGAGWAVALLYALFSGWGIPAQRTVCMLGLALLLRAGRRQWPPLLLWLAVATGVLTLDPWAMLQAGFWLSFVAVAVLMGLGRSSPAADPPAPARERGSTPRRHQGGAPWARLVHAHERVQDGARRAGRWLGRALWALLREQLRVTLALAPLGLLFFGQLSVAGLLANLLAIPWVTLVVTPLCLAGLFWSPLWTVAEAALTPMIAGLSWLAAWPWAQLFWPVPPWPWVALAMLAVLPWWWPSPWSLRWVLLPLCLPIWGWQAPRPAPGSFELLALDVGQGTAVLLRTHTHSLMVDSGPRWGPDSDAGHRTVLPLLLRQGEPLAGLLLSHSDQDHVGGAQALLQHWPGLPLWLSLPPEHPLWAQPGARPCARGQSWSWDGVRLTVLHPPPDWPHGQHPPNHASCVLLVEDAQGHRALLSADIEAAQEAALLRQGLGPVDWLMVPHHGSRTSSSPAFVQALRPRVAVVQAGYLNRYGHPHPLVEQRYAHLGPPGWVSTVTCGAALWHSAQPTQVVCERARQRRYWHHDVQKN